MQKRGGRDFCGGHPNTSCSLINRASMGFRGINGDLPAKRGSPPFIPRPIAPQLTAARGVFFETRAIPPQIQSENLMTQSDKPSTDAGPDTLPNSTSSVSLEQYYKERLANMRQHLPVIAKQLKVAGVARVDIHLL